MTRLRTIRDWAALNASDSAIEEPASPLCLSRPSQLRPRLPVVASGPNVTPIAPAGIPKISWGPDRPASAAWLPTVTPVPLAKLCMNVHLMQARPACQILLIETATPRGLLGGCATHRSTASCMERQAARARTVGSPAKHKCRQGLSASTNHNNKAPRG